jgi:hypothetical protein
MYWSIEFQYIHERLSQGDKFSLDIGGGEMEKTRTYGIEIECHSRVRNSYLAGRIARALRDDPRVAHLGHTCVSGGFSRQTEQNNFTVWNVKTDGSLYPSPFGTHEQDTEIVSPILKGEDGFKVLEVVCEVIEPYVKVSRRCGLHVHHGIQSTEELYRVAKAWVRHERFFMGALPDSRQKNYYCVKWVNKGSRG